MVIGATERALVLGVNNNDRFNINANDNINNNRPARGMTSRHTQGGTLWAQLTSFDNLRTAYENAKKHKANNPSVKEFSKMWAINLALLRYELQHHTYQPQPLTRFVLRDPKTRVIYKSHFRDRIVHHAIVNILQPIYEPQFIHDSYASRKGKGTTTALQRYQQFLRKVTNNGKLRPDARNKNQVQGYVLKCDIKHYFETVDHETLITILRKRINDEKVIELIRTVLKHYPTQTPGKGMPLGNWTSQFFANIYLNELDQYIKHRLRAKYYLRYVDDFVILSQNKAELEQQLHKIRESVNDLKLELHPTKCKIIPLRDGVSFLGFKIFYCYRTVRKRNKRKIVTKIRKMLRKHQRGEIEYDTILDTIQGWNAYAMQGNTYKLRQKILQWTQDELTQIAEKHKAQRNSANKNH